MRLSDRCSQCGNTYGDRACGPTHAVIANQINLSDDPVQLIKEMLDEREVQPRQPIPRYQPREEPTIKMVRDDLVKATRPPLSMVALQTAMKIILAVLTVLVLLSFGALIGSLTQHWEYTLDHNTYAKSLWSPETKASEVTQKSTMVLQNHKPRPRKSKAPRKKIVPPVVVEKSEEPESKAKYRELKKILDDTDPFGIAITKP